MPSPPPPGWGPEDGIDGAAIGAWFSRNGVYVYSIAPVAFCFLLSCCIRMCGKTGNINGGAGFGGRTAAWRRAYAIETMPADAYARHAHACASAVASGGAAGAMACSNAAGNAELLGRKKNRVPPSDPPTMTTPTILPVATPVAMPVAMPVAGAGEPVVVAATVVAEPVPMGLSVAGTSYDDATTVPAYATYAPALPGAPRF